MARLAACALSLALPPAPPAPVAAQPAAQPAAPEAAPELRLPPLAIRDRTLANGLRVLSVRDGSSPTVAVQVWYRVGSKDDPEGRSGFAHLFEHLMFKATANMAAETLDRLTEDVGGFNNAFTADDMTVYYEVVPASHLESILWAEADRMGSLVVDEAVLGPERDVVKEEFRQRYLARPYGMFSYLLEQLSFDAHPYRRPGIGSIAELEAASLADVQAFHRTFYRPDNAILVVVGDFEPERLDGWVDRYFAPIARPLTPIPRVTAQEPPRRRERRVVERRAGVPLPRVALSWLAPPAGHHDAAALEVAAALLGTGRASRLYRALVHEQGLAADVGASYEGREHPGLFTLTATVASGHPPEAAERALAAELRRLQGEPASEAELERARRQLVTAELRDRESNLGKALAIGEAAGLLDDPQLANTTIARLQAVRAADVQRALRGFRDEQRLVLHYLPPGETAPAGSPPAGRPEGR